MKPIILTSKNIDSFVSYVLNSCYDTIRDHPNLSFENILDLVVQKIKKKGVNRKP